MTRVSAGGTKPPWVFGAILGAFLVLALLYNVLTPIYETPDELQHAAFVAWLADGQGLPIVDLQDVGPWAQEGTQPPLYYWLVARLIGWLPHPPADDLAELNPFARIGDPLHPDNKNQVVHVVDQEGWPYPPRVLFVRVARFVSTLMGMATLVLIYRLGVVVFPRRPGIALGMMGLVAFTPQFLFLSASINNDNLVILLSSAALVVLARWLARPGLPGWLPLAGMGALLGLAALAKFGGLLLWPLTGGALVFLAWREKRLRWLIPAGALVLGAALAISGWWFVRNYQLYGDLSGLEPHLAIMGTRKRVPSLAEALREFNGFRYSFWALFGWFNILVPEPFYWLMDGLTVLGLAGMARWVVRGRRRSPGAARPALVLLACWLGLVALGVVRWTFSTPASQGRLLYPALPAIVLFMVVGWSEFFPERLWRSVGLGGLGLWAAWAALCPALFIQPAYALPERVEAVEQVGFEPVAVHVTFDGCCELLGYRLQAGQNAHAGDLIPLSLVWRVLEPVEGEYAVFVHATTADDEMVGQVDTFHGGGMYPIRQAEPGEVFADTVYVPISWQVEGPELVRFNVGVQGLNETTRLPAYSAEGQKLDAVFVGEVGVEPEQWPEPSTDGGIDAVFGQQIRLGGVELSATEVRPGDVLTATLEWQALTQISEDFVGFVHLVGPDGEDVAQDDHLPLRGRYPTRLWQADTVLRDAYRLELPANMEPGTYRLLTGFYRPATSERLEAIAQATGERWRDDLVLLGAIVVRGESD